MQLIKDNIHSKIYFYSIVLLVMSIPLSQFIMSVSQFILLGNWLIEGNFASKLIILKQRKSILIFISIFVIHLLYIFLSDDILYWFKDVRNKLPLLILPVIIGTSEGFNNENIKKIFTFFYLALFIGTMSSLAVIFGFIEKSHNDFRDISIYISHIRFAILIDLGIFSAYYFIRNKKFQLSNLEKKLFLISAIWFSIFLFILNSLTGIIIFLLISIFILMYNVKIKTKLSVKLTLLGLFVTVLSTTAYYVSTVYHDFYDGEKVDLKNLDKQTAYGNYYYHDTLHLEIENGSYTNLYVCEPELEAEWNKVSTISYKEKDKNGNDIKFTLRRYINSLGLRKDAVGVRRLNNVDIEAIENGIANNLYIKKSTFYTRIHQSIWEIDSYFRGGNPSGQSLIQRIEYLKASFAIISNNFWFGVGNGDIEDSFSKYYNDTHSSLNEMFRHKSHNQMVLFFVAFGFVGFVLIMFCIFAPVFFEKQNISFLFKIFFAIAILSMFNEDTLETQAGITFFVFFYSLLLFGFKNSEKKIS
jgi:hypothetical protein